MDNDFDLMNFEGDIFDDFTKTAQKSASKNAKNKIPVVMISGFLGSGKTTLLNHILRNSPDKKIGAIVNDFGKINIDSQLTASAVSEKTVELSNGCVCCMLGDNGLREPLDILANENSEIDAIILEASGVAEPYDLMNALRFSGNDFTFFGGNIYLVDAQNFELCQQEFPVHFRKCLQTSDIILINKIDLVSSEKIAEIRNFIRDLNPRAPIIESKNSEIDPRIILADFNQNFEIETHHCHENCDHHHHIHEQFQTISFETNEPLSPQKFINFLDNLPENLFRMKGFCYFGMKGYEQKYLLQIVGKTIDISAVEWDNNENLKTELVLIGAKMDKKSVEKNLREMVDPNPEDISPENMMNFERFLIS